MESGRRATEIFAGPEILEDQEMHPAHFRSPYGTILPRNYFILKKRVSPALRDMALIDTQDSNRTSLFPHIIKVEKLEGVFLCEPFKRLNELFDIRDKWIGRPAQPLRHTDYLCQF
jgi:hypothetical protein